MTILRVCFGLVLFSYLVYGFPNSVAKDAYPFPFVPRAKWGALDATDSRKLELPAPYVVIHHTYIPGACTTFDQCSADMRAMQRYHMGLDYGDIGYNFCIGTEGTIYEGRGWETIGVHAGKANNVSIGISLIGDFRVDLPPPQQLEVAKHLIEVGVRRGYINADYKLIGHRQAMATECPGGALFEHISQWDHFSPGNFS